MVMLEAQDDTKRWNQYIRRIIGKDKSGLVSDTIRMPTHNLSSESAYFEENVGSGLYEAVSFIRTSTYTVVDQITQRTHILTKEEATNIAEGLQHGILLSSLAVFMTTTVVIKNWQDVREEQEVARKVNELREDIDTTISKLNRLELVDLQTMIAGRYPRVR